MTHPTHRTVSDQSDRIPKSTSESFVRTFLEDLHGIAEDQSPSIRARGAQSVIDLTVDDVVQSPSIGAPVSQTVNDLTVDDVVQSPSIGAPVGRTVIDLTADDEDNGRRFSFNVLQSFTLEPPPKHHQWVDCPNKVLALTAHVIVISSDDPPPPLEHHPHVVDMEVETPNNSAEVEPCLVVISSDDEDDESKMPFHQSVILEPVEKLLKKNMTYCVEIGDQRKELETLPGLHIGIHKEIDVSATENMDGVENTEHIWADEDAGVCTAEDMMDLELIDHHSHDILVQDCLESKYEREEFETPPDNDVDIDGNNMVSQRTSEKQQLNYQSSSRYIEDIECMASSTELGIMADQMDVGTDTHDHVNEQNEDQRPSYSFQEVFSPQPSYPVQDVVLTQPSEQPFSKDFKVRKCVDNKASVPEASLSSETEINKNVGVYVGVEDDEIPGEDDYMGDEWLELSMALESSKDVCVDPSTEEKMSEGEEDCEHSFVLKDDTGYVCRICGLIDRRIDTIFEFQFSKAKRSTRTYMPNSRNGKDRDSTEIDEVKLSEDGLIITEISAHPRHFKQMKPHQLQGFNFLVSNLVGDKPGGCILAHAPGSGKTFMIISFMQSFLAKYPNARPLVVLPKGILDTWKKEFKYWQVEDIPLFDLYEAKGDGRSQQLVVLKKWVNQKSILFLGYKQFSSIVCDRDTSQATTLCQEILLKAPSILIMDEGHTPRNDNTDVFQSIAKLQTPRKVVLSGTIYQNHVKEVFNILNLVRPKFLRSETSRPIVKRIMSIVDIPGVRNQFKAGCDAVFYELVEDTLQKDKDFRRKVNVIHDLRDMTSKVLHYYKGDSLDELPGLVDFTVVLNLSDWQKQKIKKEFKKFARKFKQSSVGSAVYLHPKLYSVSKDWKVADSNDKMDELVEKIDLKEGVKAKFFLNMLSLCESSGEKLLVFSQYLPPLKFLERLTAKKKGWSPGREMFVITGESKAEKREWSMERFNNSPDAKVFFGSIKACGEGISLVGASRVIILDVHLNPSVTRQAIGRAFRPGQKRKVFVYRLVAGDSPEEVDHSTCVQKELIAKMWFEWNKYCGYQNFEVDTVDVKECGDAFLESPVMGEDVKVLYRR